MIGDGPAATPRGVDHVVTGERVDDQRGPFAGEAPTIVISSASAVDGGPSTPSLAGGHDHVVAVGGVDGDRVGRRVVAAGDRRGAQVGVDRRAIAVPLRSLTTRLSTPPWAVRSMSSTSLRSITMLATLRDEAHPLAVGRHVEVLGDVGAVEQHRVGAVLALDGVVAVTRVPAGRCRRRHPDPDVVAAVAVDEVVAVAAEQDVVAVAAVDGVVPGAAVDGDLDQRGQAVGRR